MATQTSQLSEPCVRSFSQISIVQTFSSQIENRRAHNKSHFLFLWLLLEINDLLLRGNLNGRSKRGKGPQHSITLSIRSEQSFWSFFPFLFLFYFWHAMPISNRNLSCERKSRVWKKKWKKYLLKKKSCLLSMLLRFQIKRLK